MSNQFHFITFHLSVLTMVLDTKQAIPDRSAIHESMPLAGYPKNTCPACTLGTSRTNLSPSYPRCLGLHPNLDSKPPLLSPRLSVVQGPPPPHLQLVGPERARSTTREQRVFSVPIHKYAHKYALEILPRDLCNDRSLIDTDREKV